ncbi:thiopeptide-type bacteriocin biosynthesis protein [Streptomyces sp. NPDC047043]|uniref:thiopeptide-type bacteriocin biosynthesis protein n=1 Tax=Streptomyces sp. NPDC047043 TaxID=3154497 RepID=UPI0033EC680C
MGHRPDRGLLEENHLRLRVAAADPAAHAAVTQILVTWVRQLQDDSLVFDGYLPEIGRYGTGAATPAAEDVFTADSNTVHYALADLPHADRRVLAALGMIDKFGGARGPAEAFGGRRQRRSCWRRLDPAGRPCSLWPPAQRRHLLARPLNSRSGLPSCAAAPSRTTAMLQAILVLHYVGNPTYQG